MIQMNTQVRHVNVLEFVFECVLFVSEVVTCCGDCLAGRLEKDLQSIVYLRVLRR